MCKALESSPNTAQPGCGRMHLQFHRVRYGGRKMSDFKVILSCIMDLRPAWTIEDPHSKIKSRAKRFLKRKYSPCLSTFFALQRRSHSLTVRCRSCPGQSWKDAELQKDEQSSRKAVARLVGVKTSGAKKEGAGTAWPLGMEVSTPVGA